MVLWNYEYCEETVMEASKILFRAYEERENAADKLSSVLLGEFLTNYGEMKLNW